VLRLRAKRVSLSAFSKAMEWMLPDTKSNIVPAELLIGEREPRRASLLRSTGEYDD
jgi:hypothetical protein